MESPVTARSEGKTRNEPGVNTALVRDHGVDTSGRSQRRTSLSSPPARARRPSGEKATATTLAGDGKRAICRRPARSQSLDRSVPSAREGPEAVGRDGHVLDDIVVALQAADLLAESRWARSQIRTSPSPPEETAVRPSGATATLMTGALCPLKIAISRPVSRSQSRTVQSSPPVSAAAIGQEGDRPDARRVAEELANLPPIS